LLEITVSPDGPPPPGGKSGHSGKTFLDIVAAVAQENPLRAVNAAMAIHDRKSRRCMANPHEKGCSLKQRKQQRR
jgi:hypothetical protein